MSETTLEKLERAEEVPSTRDWEIYRYVKVEEWSTRIVAAEYGISQTRVCQIVERVREYVLTTTPALSDAEEAQRLAASKQLAAERIDFLYGEAVRCYYRSKRAEKIIREPHERGKSGCTTTRESEGDARYLQVAARLAVMGSKLPQVQRRVVDVQENEVNETCSAGAGEQGEVATATAQESAATAAAMLSCVEQSRSLSAAESVAARPVQKAVQQPAEKQRSASQAARREAFFQTG